MEYLFVYGTLRRGGSNHDLLQGRFATVESAFAPHMRLYASAGGGYPYAVIRHGSTVHGDLVGFTRAEWVAALPRLDLLEGFDARRPSTSHYLRVRRSVTTDAGTTVTAFVYLASARVRVTEGRFIAGGDWLTYIALPSTTHRRPQSTGN